MRVVLSPWCRETAEACLMNTDAPHSEQAEGGSRKRIVSRIRGKAKFFVGFHRVHAMVLKFVRTKLIHQADSAALLRQVQQDARR